MSEEHGTVSKVSLAALTVKVIFTALGRACVSPFKSNGARTMFRDVAYSAFRTQLAGLTIAQEKHMFPATAITYTEYMKKTNQTPQITELPSGLKLLWIGSRSAKTTLLYFHGGGYVNSANDGQYAFYEDLVASVPDLAIALPAYTLAPEAQYPTQLAQGVEALAHLLSQKPASSILIGGDSAGGNLTLSVLSHLLHPHPDPRVPRLDAPTEKFRAFLLISPWVSFDTRHASYTKNAQKDVFDGRSLDRWAKAFLGPNAKQPATAPGQLRGDNYSEPLVAPEGWWSGAQDLVDDVLVWGGGGELFLDGISAFTEAFTDDWVKSGGERRNVSLVVTPECAHIEMALDKMFGYKDMNPGGRDVEGWLKAKL
ncbi:alpha/beta-hydrolase [Aulographum hederae CBS 113979]|uniref:Alpha/beta-hydrolase n=1 Tax=Aulographum hederae CBS 113979 TaxID=1176131 RepID=A0A6G1GNM2_9PEZI|nr:alpha/beta-hydrolase [Aulographum hederae CBS 113979]